MSTSVDERVVQMRFDNAQFESGVQTSLSTLDKLKQALRLDGVGSGLDSISNKANGINFSGLSGAVDGVGSKFSALETIATGALLNIGMQVENTAARMVKSLTIDNISAGFNEYELKMGSIQTIMAGTGESLETVNGYLNELNEYSDKTIYSFADMTNNIGKFTNAGVSLKDSVAAIQGVANVAALSGANAQQASHAMYNFAQALSSGYVKLIDWKSIENANMATVGFKDELLKTAESLKLVEKQADGTYKTLKGNVVSSTLGFNDSLKDQWMTTEVLTQTLQRYTDETTEIGKKAMAAATEVKSFSMMIDTVKEAVGSSWAKTWELIFGDFEEGKQLWTGMEKVLESMFVGGNDEINSWLQYWHDSVYHGRKDLIEGFKNLYYGVKLYVEPIKQSFRAVFGLGENAEASTKRFGPILVTLTKKFKDFTTTLQGGLVYKDEIHSAAQGFFLVIKALITGFGGLLKILSPIMIPIRSLIGLILRLAGQLGQLATKTVLYVQNSKTLQSIIQTISNGFKIFCVTLAAVIDNFDIVLDILYDVGQILWSKIGPVFTSVGEKISAFLKPVKDFIHTNFGDAFENLWNGVQKFIQSGGKSSLAFAQIKHALDDIKNSAPVQAVINGVTKAFNVLSGVATKVINVIKNVIKYFKTAFAEGGVMGVFKAFLNLITSGFTNLKNSILKFISNNPLAKYISNLKQSASDVEGPFAKVVNAIKNFASQITPGKIAVIALSAVLLMLVFNISKVLSAFAGVADAITDFIGAFKLFAKRNNTLLQIAVVIGVLAGSLYLLAQVPAEDLKNATSALLKLIGVTGAIVVLLTILSKFDSKSNAGTALLSVSIALLALAGSAVILVYALSKLKELKVDKDLLIKMGLLVGIMTIFAVITRILGNIKGSFGGAATILAFSAGIWLIVESLMKIASADTATIKKSTDELIKIMLMLAVLTATVGKISIFSGIGLLGLVWALSKVLPTLEELAGTDYPNIKKAIKDNIEIIALLGVAAVAMTLLASVTGKGVQKFGKGMLSMAIAIGLLTVVVFAIGKMNPGVAKRGTKFLAACLGMFAILALVTAKIPEKNGINKFGRGMIAISVACLILTGTIAILGSLPVNQVKQGELALLGIVGMLGAFELVSALSARIAGQNSGIKYLMPLVAGVAVLAIELIALSFVPWDNLKRGMIGLGAVVLALAVVTISMSKAKTVSIGGFIEMVLLLASVTGALYLLSSFDWKSMVGAAAAISLVAVGLSGALWLLSGVGATAGLALKGIGVLDALILDLFVVVSGIIAIASAFDPSVVDAGISILQKIGNGLGSVLGGFVGNFAAGVMSGLPDIGTSLSDFATNGKAFFDLCKNGTFEGAGKGVSALADVFIKLAAGDFINCITSLFGGGTTSLAEFGTQLQEFGTALVGYSDTISGLNVAAVEASASAGAILAELAKDLPNSGGLLGKVLGENDWATFSNGLVQFGSAMAGYANQVANLDVSAIETSASAGKILAELADCIPNYGGLLADALGDNDWVSFSNGLVQFGSAMSGYSTQVAGLDVTAIEKSASAGTLLAQLATTIPNYGGLLATALGENDWVSFSNGLVKFGTALKDYAGIVAGMDLTAVAISAKAGGMLSSLANTLPNSGGILSKFFGDNKIDDFGKNLVSFGKKLVDYSNEISNVNAGSIAASTTAISGIISIANLVKDNGLGERGFLGGNAFKDFGKNLVDFAQQINTFSFNVAQLDADAATAAAASFKEFVTAISGITEIDTSNIASFATSMEGLAHSGTQGFINQFAASGTDVTTAVDTFVGYFITDLGTAVTNLEPCGHEAVTQFITGVNTEATTSMPTTGTSLIDTFVSGISETANTEKLKQCGADAVQGFIDGVNLDTVRQIGNSLGVEFLAGVSESTGWHSPWETMVDCGHDATNGLVEGVTDGRSEEAGYMFGEAFVDGFRESTGWYCTPARVKEFNKDANDGMVEESKKNSGTAKKAGGITGNAYIDGMIESAKGGAGGYVDKLVEDVGKLGSKVTTTATSVYKDPEAAFKSTYEVVQKAVEETGDKAEETGEKVEEAGEKVEKAGNQTETASKKVSNATKTVKEAGETIETTSQTTQDYTDTMSYASDVVMEYDRVYGHTSETIGDTTSLEASKAAVEQLALATYEASKKAEDSTASAKKSAKEAGSTLDEIKKSFAGMRDSLTKTISGQMDIFKKFDKKTDLSADELLKNMQSQVNGVSEWAANIEILAEKGIDQGLLKKLSEMGPQGSEYVNAFMQMTGEQLQQANQLFATSLALPGTAATQVMASYAYAGNNAVDGFLSGFSEKSGDVEAKSKEIASVVGETFKREAESGVIKEAGEKVPETVGTSIEENSDKAEEGTTGFAKDVAETLETNLVDAMPAIAENMCKTLAQSLRDNSDVVKEAAAEVGNSGNSGMKDSAEINSPSKVWMGFGNYMVQGLVDGLHKYGYLASEASAKVANDSIGELANSLNMLSDIAIDSEFQPTITPVLDLSNVRAGSREIGSIFSAQNATIGLRTPSYSLSSIRKESPLDPRVIGEVIGNKVDSAMREYSQQVSDAINSSSQANTNVSVVLEGDSNKIFRVVKSENDRMIKSTGFNPLGGTAGM